MKKLSMLCMVLGLLLLAAPTTAELMLVENFDGIAAGTVADGTATRMNGLTSAGPLGGYWDNAEESGYQTLRTSGVVLDGDNHIISMENKNLGYRGWSVSDLANPIDEGETGSLFFRFYYGENGSNDDLSLYAGVHNFPNGDTDPLLYVNSASWTSDFMIAGFYASGTNGSTFKISTIDESTDLATGLNRNQWYSVWMNIDNAADTFDLYIEEAADGAGDPGVPAAAAIAEGLAFNATPTNPISGPVAQNGKYGSPRQAVVKFDEIWWDGGTVPEPATIMLLGLGGLLLRKKRS